MQYRELAGVRALAAKALTFGAERKSLSHVEWDVGARCDAPVNIVVVGRGDMYNFRSAVNPGHFAVTLNGLPCRKCPKCLRIRATLWRERAMRELACANRTWFVTLTMKPEVQHRVFMEAMREKNAKGWLDVDFSGEDQEFLLRTLGGFNLVTKFWKSVRKPLRKQQEEPILLRYLLIAEKHQSGLPHYHALVHDCGPSPITYRRMEQHWLENGFFNAKLVGSEAVDNPRKAASYVTKYIAKDMLCRVRASQSYGNGASLAPPQASLAGDGAAGVFRRKTLSNPPQGEKEVYLANLLWS